MKYKFICDKDCEYFQEVMLRWEQIFKPLGKPPGSERKRLEEEQSLHFVAIEQKKVVGCVLFHPWNLYEGQLNQLAFSPDYRGKCFGRQMMTQLEEALVKRGIHRVYLTISEMESIFYHRMGYRIDEKVLNQEGNFDVKMSKSLIHEQKAS